jgi:hypothetical protein
MSTKGFHWSATILRESTSTIMDYEMGIHVDPIYVEIIARRCFIMRPYETIEERHRCGIVALGVISRKAQRMTIRE